MRRRSKPPLSLRRTLAEMVRTGREQYRILIWAALIVFIPLGLFDVLDEHVQEPLRELSTDEISVTDIVAGLGAGIVHAAVALSGEIFYAGAVAAAVLAVREGLEPSLRGIARGLPYGRLIAVDLLVSFVVAVGFVALIVPGLIALGRFALVAPAVKLEHLGVRAAFRRSNELVRGRTGKVLLLVLPAMVVSDTLSSLVQSETIGSIGESFAGDWLAATLSDMVTAPFFALAVVVLFFELRAAQSPDPRSSSLAR